MFKLNPFAISNLLIIISYLPILIFLAFKGKTKLIRVFMLQMLCVFMWGIIALFISITINQNFANILWKVADVFVIFIPVFFQHAVLIMTRSKSKYYLIFIYTQAIFLICAIIAGKMAYTTILIADSFYFVDGRNPLNMLFTLLWFTIATISNLQFILFYKKRYPEQKTQFRLLILASIGYLGGANNFVTAIFPTIYPYGNFLIPIHSIIITYAVLRHQLLNIEFAVKKSIVYASLVATISLAYLIGVLLMERFVQGALGYSSGNISLFTAFFVGLLFCPLRTKIQEFVDKYFFKGTQAEIAHQNELLRREVEEKEKYKSLSTLASGMAHEVKNPLTALTTFSEYLPKKMDNKEFLEKFSRIIPKEIDRVNDLVHQLLDYGKPAPVVKQETDIHKLLKDTVEALNNTLIAQNIPFFQR